MTRLDLQNLVLQWVDDDAGGYFDPTNFVQPSLNRALLEVQKRLILAGEMYYLKMPPSETQTVVNQATYVLPDDFLKLHRMVYVISGSGINETVNSLSFITLNQQDLIGTTNTGTPVVFNIQGNKITLYPTPDKATTLRLWYSYRAAAMTSDSSTPDCPEEFQEFIAILACMDCFIKDDRMPTNILTKKAYYERLLEDMAEDRSQQGPRMVVVTENEGNYMPF